MTLARIGRFQVERALGSGSFATVWLARDEDLDGWVAIKLLAENWSLNADARRRFMEEARALRHLDSDRIVRVYEVGHLPDERPYMVMEFADRGTLEDRMRLRAQLDQPFSVSDAAGLSVEIAECLIAVHDLRIVHRDVKPSNVLFRGLARERQESMRREGKLVATERTLLGDFGIARRLERVMGHTMVVGSPQYMAPEQADPARAGAVDFRGDVYSAAVILYELLAGRLPYRFESVTELRHSEAVPAPPPLRTLRADVPAALARVVDVGLAPNPADRFASAWEWRDALRDALRAAPGEPSSGAQPRSVPEARPEHGTPEVITVPMPGRSDDDRLSSAMARPAAHRTAPATLRGTVPAGTRRSTAVLQEDGARAGGPPGASSPGPGASLAAVPPRAIGQFAQPDGSVNIVTVRALGALVALAGVLMMTSLLLPWARVSGPAASADRLGAEFRGGSFAALGAVALFLLGLRLWRTRRRWVASLAGGASLLVGLGGLVLSFYELIGLEDRLRAGVSDRLSVTQGSGLYVIVAASLLAIVAGARALRTTRRMRRQERYPKLRML